MYYDEFFPFYASFASPAFLDGERLQEAEFSLMKSYYPKMARKIQDKVEKECQYLDYEGSRLYDEYPDRFMLRQLCRKIGEEIREEIRDDMSAQNISDKWLDDLIQVLVYQEISRRRCRRHRCREKNKQSRKRYYDIETIFGRTDK